MKTPVCKDSFVLVVALVLLNLVVFFLLMNILRVDRW